MEWDRTLTDVLCGGDQHYRLCQEVILGIGGVRMLRALGHDRLTRFHMNEGHASLLTVELIDEEVTRAGRSTVTHEDIEAVREQCIFTTHTKEGRDGGDGPRVVSSLYDKLEQTVIPHEEKEALSSLPNFTFLILHWSSHADY